MGNALRTKETHYLKYNNIKIMTNKEIKLELAKAALCNNNDLHSVIEFYEWVVNDEECANECSEAKNESSIIKLVNEIALHQNERFATILSRVFARNNIDSVEKLLKVGRRNFRKYRNVGNRSVGCVDDALAVLYGITEW